MFDFIIGFVMFIGVCFASWFGGLWIDTRISAWQSRIQASKDWHEHCRNERKKADMMSQWWYTESYITPFLRPFIEDEYADRADFEAETHTLGYGR